MRVTLDLYGWRFSMFNIAAPLLAFCFVWFLVKELNLTLSASKPPNKRADYVACLLSILHAADFVKHYIRSDQRNKPTRAFTGRWRGSLIVSETFAKVFISLSSLAFQVLFFFRKLPFNPLVWARNQPMASYKFAFNLSPSLQYRFLFSVYRIFSALFFFFCRQPSRLCFRKEFSIIWQLYSLLLVLFFDIFI